MEFLAIGALALLALAALGGEKKSSTDTPAAADLKRLFAENPTAAQAVSIQIGAPDPAVLMQTAAQLLAKFPALAQDLAEKAKALVVPVAGKSGTLWNVWVKDSTPTSRTVVVLLGGQKVMTYNASTDPGVPVEKNRTFVSSEPGVDSATAARARADFV